MTVRELLSRIDSNELAEWMAYFELEPWGEEVADRRSAIVASVIANIHRGKNRSPYKLEHFMPIYDRPQQSWQEQKRMLMLAFGVK